MKQLTFLIIFLLVANCGGDNSNNDSTSNGNISQQFISEEENLMNIVYQLNLKEEKDFNDMAIIGKAMADNSVDTNILKNTCKKIQSGTSTKLTYQRIEMKSVCKKLNTKLKRI